MIGEKNISAYKTAEVDKNQTTNDLLVHVSDVKLIIKQWEIAKAFKEDQTQANVCFS